MSDKNVSIEPELRQKTQKTSSEDGLRSARFAPTAKVGKIVVQSARLLGEHARNAMVQVGFLSDHTPIVPERSASNRTLVIVVAIMSFLTCLTFGVVSVIWTQASLWQANVSSEVTIQVRPIDGVDLSSEMQKARALAENTPGILSVVRVSDEWSERLLEPWLGTGFDLAQLPVPQILILELDPDRRANLRGLSDRLEAQVQGASLDDHRVWLDRLSSMANTMIAIGLGVMALMLTAMILSVTFATQGAMATNHDVVEVLHFVGARDGFIAGEFQARFLKLGLKGALAGGLTALLCFFILSFWLQVSTATPQADQIQALFGRFDIGFWGYLGIVFLVVLIAFLTAITSRIAVFRYLNAMS